MQDMAKKIEELRRICCEETDRARQARFDVLSMHQERNPTTVSQLLIQVQDLQNKVNSLSDAREFHDPGPGSSSGATHVPSEPPTIQSPRTTPSRDSGLPHDTGNGTVITGNVFERLLARDGRNSTIFNNSKNFAPSSEELSPDTTETTRRRESDMKRESLDTSIPLPHFQSGDVEADGQPSKKSKKSGAKGSVAILKESTQLGYVSQDSYPRKSILRESAKLGSKHAVKILQGQLAPTQKSGKKGSISTNYPKVCAS